MSRLRLPYLRTADMDAFPDRRLKRVTGSAVIRNLTLISQAINIACKAWGIAMRYASYASVPCALHGARS